MAIDLKGKVAIVTGGATGIGEAISHKYAKLGARVVVCGLESDPVDDVVNAIRERGADAIGFKGDISEPDHAVKCVQTAVDQFGRLDILVNNAGVFLATAPVEKYPDEAFLKTVKDNIHSVFFMTKHALPHLQKSRGVVISAGSEAGIMGEPKNSIYGGTKGWVHAFMKGVASEQAIYGVRANCVCPGPIDTAWTHKETSPMDKKMEKDTVNGTLLGRRGTPEEVANVYAFLASDEASYVTAALWTVDGGTTVSKGTFGQQVPSELRAEPKGELNLQHSRDGLRNKEIQTVT